MFRTLISGAFALTLTLGQAHGLSCARSDVAAAYKFVETADDSFVILRGRFSFDAALLPGPTAPPVDMTIAAKFDGKLLTGKGFTDDVTSVPTSILLRCVGPWCARMSPGVDYLVFAKQTPDELVLTADPCYQFVFANPTDEMVSRVESCASGGDCEVQKPAKAPAEDTEGQ